MTEPEISYMWERVVNDLVRRIQSGEFEVGDRLPGEVALVTHYGVASHTVRRAIRELRDRGVVRTLPAKGTFVVRVPDTTEKS